MAPTPPPVPRDRSALWLVLLGAAAVLAAALAFGACAATVRPECPLGSRPVRVDTGSTHDGSTNAKGDLPSQSVTAGATWKATANADWGCAPICAKGQLLSAREETGKLREVKCLPEKCPEGGKTP